MSVARPARSVLGRCLASTRTAPAIPYQQFHSSAVRSKRRTRFQNVKAQQLGLLSPKFKLNDEALEKYQKEVFPEYTAAEIELLKAKYTPEQVEALLTAQKAVDPGDIAIQGRLRSDPHRPEYIDDYSQLDPRYDLKPDLGGTPREPHWPDHNEWIDNYGEHLRQITDKKTSDQLTRAMARALRRVKESKNEELIDLTKEELEEMEKDPELAKRYLIEEDDDGKEIKKLAKGAAPGPEYMTRAQAIELDKAVDAEWEKELGAIESMGQKEEMGPTDVELLQEGPMGTERLHSAEAVELGKVHGVEGLYKTAVDPDDHGQDDTGRFQELKRLTGMSLDEIQSLQSKALVIRSVSNQTRLGKVRSSSVMAIAGNGNGRLGLGMAKSTEPQVATETAMMLAIRNMKPIRRYENRTIFGDVTAKVSGTVVELKARPPGFGLRVPHRLFEMCRAAGIHDIAAKMPRSKNPMNSVKATYQALTNQPDPEEIAIGRGKKLVDVRKVYYGGSVL